MDYPTPKSPDNNEKLIDLNALTDESSIGKDDEESKPADEVITYPGTYNSSAPSSSPSSQSSIQSQLTSSATLNFVPTKTNLIKSVTSSGFGGLLKDALGLSNKSAIAADIARIIDEEKTRGHISYTSLSFVLIRDALRDYDLENEAKSRRNEENKHFPKDVAQLITVATALTKEDQKEMPFLLWMYCKFKSYSMILQDLKVIERFENSMLDRLLNYQRNGVLFMFLKATGTKSKVLLDDIRNLMDLVPEPTVPTRAIAWAMTKMGVYQFSGVLSVENMWKGLFDRYLPAAADEFIRTFTALKESFKYIPINSGNWRDFIMKANLSRPYELERFLTLVASFNQVDNLVISRIVAQFEESIQEQPSNVTWIVDYVKIMAKHIQDPQRREEYEAIYSVQLTKVCLTHMLTLAKDDSKVFMLRSLVRSFSSVDHSLKIPNELERLLTNFFNMHAHNFSMEVYEVFEQYYPQYCSLGGLSFIEKAQPSEYEKVARMIDRQAKERDFSYFIALVSLFCKSKRKINATLARDFIELPLLCSKYTSLFVALTNDEKETYKDKVRQFIKTASMAKEIFVDSQFQDRVSAADAKENNLYKLLMELFAEVIVEFVISDSNNNPKTAIKWLARTKTPRVCSIACHLYTATALHVATLAETSGGLLELDVDITFLFDFAKEGQHAPRHLDDMVVNLECALAPINIEMEKLRRRIQNNDLTLAEIKTYRGSQETLSKIFKLRNNEVVDSKKLLEDFERNREDYLSIFKVAEWLINSIKLKNNKEIVESLLAFSNEWTLKQLIDRLAALKKALSMDDRSTKIATFFFTHESHLFMYMLKEHPFMITDTYVEAQVLSDAVVQCEKDLEELITSVDVPLSRVNAIYEILKKENRSTDDELSVIHKRFNRGDAKSRVQSFTNALEFKSYIQKLKNMIAAFDVFKLECLKSEQVQTLGEICERNERDADKITFGQVERDLNQVKRILPEDFRIEHFGFFEKIINAYQFVQFFRTQANYREILAMLPNKVQGDPLSMGIVRNLNVIVSQLEPLILMKATFKELLEHVVDTYNAAQVENFLKTSIDIGTIQSLFAKVKGASLVSIVDQVEFLLQNGWFQSTLRRHPDGELFSLDTQKKSHKLDELDDLIRGTIFCSSNSTLGEKYDQMVEFEHLFKLATKIHQVRLNLEEQGHPAYQGLSTTLCKFNNDPKDASSALQELLAKLEAEHQRWTSSQQQNLNRHPLLTMLGSNQLLYFISKLAPIMKEKKPVTQSQWMTLKPYFQICLPNAQVDQIITCDALTKLIAELEPSDDLLALIGTLLTQVQELVGEENEAPPPGCNYDTITIDNYNNLDVQLLLLIYSIFDQHLPAPANILWCNLDDGKTIAWQELQMFLFRTINFEGPFVIVGVNQLAPKLKEDLLQFIQQKANKKSAETHLIFTDRTSIEMFSFLPSRSGKDFNFDPADTDALLKYFADSFTQGDKISNMFKKRNVAKFQVYCGAAGDGKSFAIDKELQLLKSKSVDFQTLVLAVNEDYSSTDFFNSLQIGHAKNIGVHVNLATTAPFSLVSRMLYNFLVAGIMHEEVEGQVQSISEDVKWNFFIEIPAMAKEAKSGSLTAKIPLVYALAEHIDVGAHIPFAIGGSAQFVCSFLHHRANLEQVLLKLPAFDEQFCHDILEKSWGLFPDVPKRKMHRAMLINLLHERCRFLQRVFLKDYEFSENGAFQMPKYGINNKFYTQLFALIMRDANHYCNKNIRRDWSSNSFLCLGDDLAVSVLQFSDANQAAPIVGCEVLKYKDVKFEPALLRSTLSLALGISDSNQMATILSGDTYVLTTDFALKLLMIHERCRATKTMILCGHTGVGKSELMRIYAKMINAPLALDFASELHNFITTELTAVPNFAIGKRRVSDLIKHILKIAAQVDPSTEQDKAKPPSSYLATVANCFARWLQKFSEELSAAALTVPLQNFLQDKTVKDVAELEYLLKQLVNTEVTQVYHKMLMHESFSNNKLREEVESIEQLAIKYPKAKFVVFIDEMNTTRGVGLLKEVFVDNSIDGRRLPANIFWVGAINPPQANNDPSAARYLVNELPVSMHEYIIDLDTLTQHQEDEFIEQLLQDKTHGPYVPDLIKFGQNFIKSQQLSNMVSIRDIMRSYQLYNFFWSKNILSPITYQPEQFRHYKALIMSIAMTYYLRLPIEHVVTKENLREQFLVELKRAFHQKEILMFEEVIQNELEWMYDQLIIDDGISKTRTLMENLFCNVVCIQANIPLIITGPPGCSKTLSFDLAIANMKGPASKSKFLQQFLNVHRFHYQCSEVSTASEIETRFKEAEDMQQTFYENRILNERCVVFLDEAGLPKRRKHALKVIHYYLDHPVCPSVLLSNPDAKGRTLDTAKTNRAIQVLQSKPSFQDLLSLAQGCLINPSAHALRHSVSLHKDDTAFILEGCCNAFQRVEEVAKNFYHQRDFVYFLRYLRKEGLTVQSRNKFLRVTPTSLLSALGRNFSGRSLEDFEKMVNLFFEEINKVLRHYSATKTFEKPAVNYNVIELLRESVNERLRPNEDPNQAAFRYVMVIDPTDVQISIPLLFDLGIIDRSRLGEGKDIHICDVSDFVEDDNQLSYSHLVSKIKLYMELGHTVILINPQPIQSSFYDVLNKHFSSLLDDDNQLRFFANVAIGSHSQACTVHPNFQIVVHVPLSHIESADGRVPLAFLNRFEKYLLSMEDVLKSRQRPQQVPVMTAIKSGIEHFVKYVNEKTFYGLVPRETLDSFMISMLELTKGLIVPTIPEPSYSIVENDVPMADDEENDDIDLLSQSKNLGNVTARLREFIRKANFFLLQIARPEAIYLQRRNLPKAYLIDYLIRQEHFSIIRFLHGLFMSKTHTTNNWIVFTRTAGELTRLHSDETLQEMIVKPVVGDEASAKEFMTVASVSSLTSSDAAESAIRTFASDAKSLLLLVADMRVVSKHQLNFLRNLITEMVASSPKKRVVIIVHFPPQLLQLAPVYDAVFLNGWSNVYIDALGVTKTDNHQFQSSADIRYWLNVAFGLQKHISWTDIGSDYQELFFRALKYCSVNLISTGLAPSLARSTKFYNRQDPYNAFRELFDHNDPAVSLLMNNIMERFALTWNLKYLDNIVEQACRAIQNGQSIISILDVVRSSWYLILTTTVGNSLVNIMTGYGLESVFEVFASDSQVSEVEQGTMRRYFQLAMKASTLDLPSDFTTIINPQIKLLTHTLDVVLQLPIFKDIFSSCERVVRQEISSLTPEKRMSDDVLDAIKMAIRKEEDLHRVIEFIESQPLLLKRFTHDYLAIVIGLGKLKEEHLLIYTKWIEQNIEHKFRSIIGLIIKKDYIKNYLGQINIVLQPLNRIGIKKHLLEEDFRENDIYQLITRHFVTNLLEAFAFEGEELDEALELWFEVFRTFRARLRDRLTSNTHLTAEHQHKMDLMRIVFHFAVNFRLSYAHIKPLFFEALSTVHIAQKDYAVQMLEKIIISTAEKCTEIVKDKRDYQEQLSQFQSDLLKEFFLPGSDTEVKVTPAIRSDLKYLVTVVERRNTSFWRVDYQHVCFLLRALLRNKQLYALVLSDVDEMLPKRMTYTPGFAREENQRTSSQVADALFAVFTLDVEQISLESALEQFDDLKSSVSASDAIYKKALEVRILQSAMSAIGNAKEPEKVVTSWSKRGIIVDLLCTKINQSIAFHAITSQESLLKILRNKPLLDALGLGNLLVADNIAFNPCLFFFMIDVGSPEGQMRVELTKHLAANAIQETVAWAQALQGPNKLLGKMQLLLVCYFEYFNKGKPCPALQQLLANGDFVQALNLRANPDEISSYRFFANGPVPYVGLDIMQKVFSLNAVQNPESDHHFRHTLVNILAITLGLPDNVNHLFNRIFTPEYLTSLAGRGPGSASNTEVDCGYIMDEFGNFSTEQATRLGPKINRLLTCFMTWAGNALSILWPENLKRNEGHAAKCCHHANFETIRRDIEAAHIELKGADRTLLLKQYIFDRPWMWWQRLSEQQILAANHIDPAFFVTQCLFEFWRKLSIGDPRARCRFETPAQTDVYEVMLKEIFDSALQNINVTKARYTEVLGLQGTVANIQKEQQRLTRKMRRYVGFPAAQYLDQALGRVDAKEYPFLRKFLDLRSKIVVLRHLPLLVSFYQWINSTFAYLISEEDSRRMTMSHVIGLLPKNVQKDALEFWETVKRAWKEISVKLQRLDACGLADIGTKQIIQLNDETLFCALIKGTDDEYNNNLIPVIEKMVALQSDLLQNATETVKNEQRSEWDPNNLCAEESFEKLSLTPYSVLHLPNDTNAQWMLTTGDLNGEFDEFISAYLKVEDVDGRLSVNVNLIRLVREILERYVSGKRQIDVSGLEKRFNFRPIAVNIGTRIDTKASATEAPNSVIPPISRFINVINSLAVREEFCEQVINTREWAVLLSSASNDQFEVQALDMFDILTQIIMHLINNYTDKDQNRHMNLEQYVVQWPEIRRVAEMNEVFKVVKEDIQLKHLKCFGKFLVEKVLSKDYQFNYGAVLNVDASAVRRIESVFQEDLDQAKTADELAKMLTVLQTIASSLLSLDMDTLKNSADALLSEMLSASALLTDEHIERYLPPSIRVKNLGPYLSLVKRSCGTIMVRLYDKQYKATNLYQEFIAPEYEKIQLTLEASEALFPVEEQQTVVIDDTPNMHVPVPEYERIEFISLEDTIYSQPSDDLEEDDILEIATSLLEEVKLDDDFDDVINFIQSGESHSEQSQPHAISAANNNTNVMKPQAFQYEVDSQHVPLPTEWTPSMLLFPVSQTQTAGNAPQVQQQISASVPLPVQVPLNQTTNIPPLAQSMTSSLSASTTKKRFNVLLKSEDKRVNVGLLFISQPDITFTVLRAEINKQLKSKLTKVGITNFEFASEDDFTIAEEQEQDVTLADMGIEKDILIVQV